ncbi:IclR family transcriptional regulator [Salinarchaeum chitinilyticum]
MDRTEIPPADEFDRQIATTPVTTFRIVETLKRESLARVSDVAEELDLAKGTVHKHLTTLEAVNYVVQEGDQYRLSLRFLGLGTSVRSQLDVYQAAYAPLENLAEATGEVASVMVPENDRGVYVVRISAQGRPDVNIRQGESVPLTATAGGKAILSQLEPAAWDRIVERQGLPELTNETVTDAEELKAELRRIRGKEHAVDRGEYRSEHHCVASPITDFDGTVVGSVTVSAPAERMDEKLSGADFVSLVGSTVDSIQSRL